MRPTCRSKLRKSPANWNIARFCFWYGTIGLRSGGGLPKGCCRVQPLGEAKHIFTHVEWRMTGLRITVEEASPSEELVWAGPDQLREEYPLPSAFRAYLLAVEA